MEETVMDSLSLQKTYERLKPLYVRLEDELRVMLASVPSSGLRIHSITSRVKDFVSASAKLERKGLLDDVESPKDVFMQINDMVGVRIVALFRNDLPAIIESVTKLFTECMIDDMVADYETSSTGYQSIHVTACLPHTFSGYRYDDIKSLRFEIQVRTIAMDAWASISHHLNYKTENDVPAEQRRSFRALSGLFYVADTEFQTLSNMREETLRELSSESKKSPESLLDRPVTADALMAYMHSSDLYIGRRHSNLEAVQSLAEQLREAGYERLTKVDEAVRRGTKEFEIQDRNRYKKFFDVGRVRVSVAAVDPIFEKIRTTKKA
jgi:putative GTP pyrophosphokinase